MIELYRSPAPQRGTLGLIVPESGKNDWGLPERYVARVREAKQHAAALFRREPWFRGVGLTTLTNRTTGRVERLVLRMLVRAQADRRLAPSSVDGVPVLTEVVGNFEAQGQLGDAIDDEILPRIAEYSSIAADHVANRLTERAPELLDQITSNPAVQERVQRVVQPWLPWLVFGGLAVTFVGSALAEGFVHAWRDRRGGRRR